MVIALIVAAMCVGTNGVHEVEKDLRTVENPFGGSSTWELVDRH
jgi:hypothetical protein